MRRFAAVLATLALAAPLYAVEPTELQVDEAYDAYLKAVCASDCPAGVTDVQARIRLLRQYCQSGGKGPDCAAIADWDPLPALLYDHQSGTWRAEEPFDARTELDVNGIPTTDLGRGQGLVVVIDNTNPLLYVATAGKIELKPIEQLTDLQTLAGLLGGNAAALVQIDRTERELRAEMADAEAEAVSEDPFATAVETLLQVVAEFRRAQSLADCVTLSSQAAGAFVQAVEAGRELRYPSELPQCHGWDGSASPVQDLLVSLAGARDTLARRCAELPKAVDTLLGLDGTNLDAVEAGIERIKTLIQSPSCADWGLVLPDDNSSVVEVIERQILGPLEDPTPDLKKRLEGLRANLGRSVEALATASELAKAIEDPITKLAAAVPALAKAAEHLDLFRDRVIRNVAGPLGTGCGATPPPCVPSSSIATFIVVPGATVRVTKWEFVHFQPVSIAVDTAYPEVVAHRPTAQTSFNVRSPLASIFDIGVAVTDTDIQSPSFGAVRQDPANFTDSPIVVGVIDQESQSGKLGLMLNVVPLRLTNAPKLVQPLGLQVGAAVDSSKPALFVGLSYGLGKYVRVGWGRTAQRVTTLREETPLGSRIANAGEIRKRSDYEYGDYWSLMVSIRALRLFTK